MYKQFNILIIESDLRKRNWLQNTLLMFVDVTKVNALSSLENFKSAEVELNNIVIIVSESQLKPLRKYIRERFVAKDVPFPILVLTKSFDSIDITKYSDFTIDAFPVDGVTPQVLEHLLKALIRDYTKDIGLKTLAHIDSLTKTTTRHLFNDRLKQALLSAKRSKESISLLYFDLDKFKLINDQYGHATGDEFLKTFVAVVKSEIREADTIGRLGGDEFAVLLPKTNDKWAKEIADRIIAQLNKPKNIKDNTLSINTSIGLVSYSGTENKAAFTISAITQKADKALYAAKASGRNQCVAYHSGLETLSDSQS